MQRKRPRESSERFHYRFLERYDLLKMCHVILVSSCVYIFLGSQGRRGLQSEEMLISGTLIALATTLSLEARKKPLKCRPQAGSKPLRIAEFGEKDEEYFYKRFRFQILGHLHQSIFSRCSA